MEHRCRRRKGIQPLTSGSICMQHARQRRRSVQNRLQACSCGAISHVRTRTEMLLAQAVYLLLRRPIVRRRFKTALQQYANDFLPFSAVSSTLQAMTLYTHVYTCSLLERWDARHACGRCFCGQACKATATVLQRSDQSRSAMSDHYAEGPGQSMCFEPRKEYVSVCSAQKLISVQY